MTDLAKASDHPERLRFRLMGSFGRAVLRRLRGRCLRMARFSGPLSVRLQAASSSKVMSSTQWRRSEEHTSELQSLMRISYAVFCLKKKHKRLEYVTNMLTSHKNKN